MAMTGGTAKCVKTTYPFTDSTKAVQLYVYYKSVQNTATNKSDVYCGMYVTTPSGWDIGPWDDYNGSYVGTSDNTFNGYIPNFSGTRWLAEDKKFTVSHAADGTGEATIKWKWGVNSPWGGYQNPSGSFTVTLPSIPRATTPKLSATKVQMGKDITITMNRASSSFTHTLKYTINGTTGTIKSGLGTSYTWTVPKSLVQYIPNKTSATVTITCETYSGSTKVGSKAVDFTATVPSASVPTLSVSSVRMGESVTITTNREVSYYTHTLKYTLNGTTGTIATGVGSSKAWTVPDLVGLIPNATSGDATISCVTYNGTAVVGTKTVDIQIKAYSYSKISFSSDAVEMGTDVTISIDRASPKYTHKITYALGNASGTIATSAGDSQVWSVPKSLVNEVINTTKGSAAITCTTYNGTAIIGRVQTFLTLKVPSASVPTVNPDPAVMGESISIVFNRKVSKYTHTLVFSIGDKQETVANISGASTDWTVPLSFAAAIPTAISGTITMKCTTFNGAGKVGEEEITFEATVPDNDATKPNFTMEFRPVHSLSSQFDGLYIQGKSKVNVTFTASSEYADIKSYAINMLGEKSTGNPSVSNVINTNGLIAVKGTVTDSRGYSRSVTEYIRAISYARPKLTAYSGESIVICTRCLSDGTVSSMGENVLIKAKASYSTVTSGGVQHNQCRVWYRIKPASSPDYSMSWKLLDGTEINAVLEEIFSIKTSYTLQIWTEDDVGEERIYTYPIAYFSVPVHMGEGGRNLGLGQFCDYSEADRIDVGWKTYFNTGIGKKVVFEAPDSTSGWEEGAILNEVFTDADTTGIMNYTLFLAIVKSTTENGGNLFPILCARTDNRIYGSLVISRIENEDIRSYSLYMFYSKVNNTLDLRRSRFINHLSEGSHDATTILTADGTSDKSLVTALYALL